MTSPNMQRYKVSVELEVEREVFPDDPDDVFQLAKIEGRHIGSEIVSALDAEIVSIDVVPVLED